jgi:hypothetical protein
MMGKIKVRNQPGQNVSQTPSSAEKLGMVTCTCHPSYVDIINKRIGVQAGLGNTEY